MLDAEIEAIESGLLTGSEINELIPSQQKPLGTNDLKERVTNYKVLSQFLSENRDAIDKGSLSQDLIEKITPVANYYLKHQEARKAKYQTNDDNLALFRETFERTSAMLEIQGRMISNMAHDIKYDAENRGKMDK